MASSKIDSIKKCSTKDIGSCKDCPNIDLEQRFGVKQKICDLDWLPRDALSVVDCFLCKWLLDYMQGQDNEKYSLYYTEYYHNSRDNKQFEKFEDIGAKKLIVVSNKEKIESNSYDGHEGFPGMGDLLLHRRDQEATFSKHYCRLGASANLLAAKAWLQRCRTSHTTCHIQPKTLLGMMVIDCSKLSVVTSPEFCVYAALSYVWGSTKTYGQEGNDRAFELPNSLPRTVRDAISVCIEMGIPYLWVDRYCIDHHDPVKQAYQIDHMDLIYRQATITFIAAAGSDSNAGLPGVNDTPRLEQLRTMVGNVEIFSLPREPERINSKWGTRAWTFQESELSRRRLWFTDGQIMFECVRMKCLESEIFENDILLTPNRGVLPSKDNRYEIRTREEIQKEPSLNYCYDSFQYSQNLHEFDRMVYAFTSRDLTSESDSIRAFAGILRHFASLDFPIYHAWGIRFIPSNAISSEDITMTFLANLCWSHEADSNRKIIHKRPAFPSWSWAGWNGHVQTSNGSIGFSVSVAKVLLESNDNVLQELESLFPQDSPKPHEYAYPLALHLVTFALSHGTIKKMTRIPPVESLRMRPAGDMRIAEGKQYWEIGDSETFIATHRLSLPSVYDGKLQEYFDNGRLEVVLACTGAFLVHALILENLPGSLERVGTMDIGIDVDKNIDKLRNGWSANDWVQQLVQETHSVRRQFRIT